MAWLVVKLANRAAAPKWKNLRRLWSKTSSVMTHLQILGGGRGIAADNSKVHKAPSGDLRSSIRCEVHAMDSRLARRRSFMMRGRPQRSVHRIQGLIDLVLANSTRRSRRRMQARSPL